MEKYICATERHGFHLPVVGAPYWVDESDIIEREGAKYARVFSINKKEDRFCIGVFDMDHFRKWSEHDGDKQYCVEPNNPQIGFDMITTFLNGIRLVSTCKHWSETLAFCEGLAAEGYGIITIEAAESLKW